MKFYETHFDEYVSSVNQYNLHPEMMDLRNSFPDKLSQFGNLIIYGPSGVGKYSQILWLLQKYSPSELKHDKHMTIQTEKQNYIYRISDIHYEVDMALLGCNSKILWHDIFSQIVDIVAMKQDKNGIILCKNFHAIHNELLDIFYSYIQQYNHPQLNMQIKFILMTEHISFLPNRILNNCHIISVNRPSKEAYAELSKINGLLDKVTTNSNLNPNPILPPILTLNSNSNIRLPPPPPPQIKRPRSKPNVIIDDIVVDRENMVSLSDQFIQRISSSKIKPNLRIISQNNYSYEDEGIEIDPKYVLNIKELRSFSCINASDSPPNEIFNIVCDAIIKEMSFPEKLVITNFRDILYDILVYNLDTVECLWYILSHFINNRQIKSKHISTILEKTYSFLKYYNNNYRPIYHLENIFFFIITKLDSFPTTKNELSNRVL